MLPPLLASLVFSERFCGQGGKVFSAFQAVVDHIDFFARLGIVARFAVLQIGSLLHPGGLRSHDDVGNVVLGLDKVELRLVGVIEIG